MENKIKALDISDLAKFEQFTESTTYYQVGMNFYRKPWARAPLFISGLLFGMSYKNKSYLFSEINQEKLSNNSLYRSYYAFIVIATALFLIFFPLPILYSPNYYSNFVQSLYFFSMPVLTIIMMPLQKYDDLIQTNTLNNENMKQTKYLKLSYITMILLFLLGYFVYKQSNKVQYSQSNLLARQQQNSYYCKEYDQQQKCISCHKPFILQIDGCVYKEYISEKENLLQYDLLLFNKFSKFQQSHYSNNDIKLESYQKQFIPIYFKQGSNKQRWIIDFSTTDQLIDQQQEYEKEQYINQEEYLPETIISRKGGLFNFIDKENKIFYNYQYFKMVYENNELLEQFKENLDILVQNNISEYQPRECIIYINNREIYNILSENIGEIKIYMRQLFQTQPFSLKLIIDLSYKDFQDYKQQTQILEKANVQYFLILPQIDEQDFQENCEVKNKQQNIDLVPYNLNEYNKMLHYFTNMQQKQIQNLETVGYSYLNLVYIYKCAFKQGISFLNQDIAFYEQDSILQDILKIWKNQEQIEQDGEILVNNISILNQNIQNLEDIQQRSNQICENLDVYQTRINYSVYQKCFSHFDNNFSYLDQKEEEQNQFNEYYEFYKYKRPNNKEAYEKKQQQYYQKLVSQDEQFRNIDENKNNNQYIEFQYDTLIDDLGAKCLDGTQPQIQYKYGKYKQRWLIYFGNVEQFNDWDDCNFDIQVQNSLNSYKGSAKYQKNQKIIKFHESQMLKDYNMLYMYSCDGSLLQGTQENPINISGQDIWLRGQNNTLSYIQHAINYLDMADSRQIIIYGNQNGAAAAVPWANYIQEVVNSINPYLEVKLIIDGGFTVDHLAYNSFDQLNFKNKMYWKLN
ncbi:hypothetical protein PPERSA_09574 [Pseudocohnilembus persalinus]|uniref:Uncharacterized protein n=1 Tax=Pseudocohnilembus persalinus TaxID=266149 RepID=A0A0V0QFR3_PSEPJ|nr:hypothetical protein PPERSA_09574 [Pseudocohnilembus persalinus]|eukprot:KRX00968.1 hypothetical protein PPERSA_09574 [Pseudocohnilembus persalinus]